MRANRGTPTSQGGRLPPLETTEQPGVSSGGDSAGPSPQNPKAWCLSSPCNTCFLFCFVVVVCFLCSQTQLLRTSEDVAKMQEELEIMRPLLEEAAKDTMLTMDQIKVGVLTESS